MFKDGLFKRKNRAKGGRAAERRANRQAGRNAGAGTPDRAAEDKTERTGLLRRLIRNPFKKKPAETPATKPRRRRLLNPFTLLLAPMLLVMLLAFFLPGNANNEPASRPGPAEPPERLRPYTEAEPDQLTPAEQTQIRDRYLEKTLWLESVDFAACQELPTCRAGIAPELQQERIGITQALTTTGEPGCRQLYQTERRHAPPHADPGVPLRRLLDCQLDRARKLGLDWAGWQELSKDRRRSLTLTWLTQFEQAKSTPYTLSLGIALNQARRADPETDPELNWLIQSYYECQPTEEPGIVNAPNPAALAQAWQDTTREWNACIAEIDSRLVGPEPVPANPVANETSPAEPDPKTAPTPETPPSRDSEPPEKSEPGPGE